MIFDYVVTLKRKTYKGIDLVSQLLLFISVVSFGMFAFETKNNYHYIIACVLVAAVWLYSILQKRKTGMASFRLPLLLSAIGWMMLPHRQIIFAVLYALAGFLEKQVKFPEEIGFSKDAIVFNSFPKKKYLWEEVLNVMLKDNLLTIDFKNNKLFQKEINEEAGTLIETEFNEFCRQQMTKVVMS